MQKNQIEPSSGYYIEHGKNNQRLIVEWSKLPFLSEACIQKMASLAHLGIDSFKGVEIDFLSAYPHAMEEDKALAAFIGLEGQALENSVIAKLHKIFHFQLNDFNEGFRTLMKDTYYHFVTIKEENTEKVQGFITFMSGGPISKNEYKIIILAVDKNARRAGLAGILITSLEKMGIPYKKILASTRPSNVAAINAYKKWGFHEDYENQKNPPPHFIKGHWVHLACFE